MTPRIIATLVAKDVSLYFRNQLFAVITVLGLVAYTVLYFVMPADIDQTLHVGLLGDEIPPLLAEFEEQGLIFDTFATQDELAGAIDEGEVAFGVALPAGFPTNLTAGSTATVYVSGSEAPEIREAYTLLIQELTNILGGQAMLFDVDEELLGDDSLGAQIPLRERFLPLFAVVLLMTEMMGLASLISSEVTTGTLQALFITPMRTVDLFTAKAITGVGLAFTQAALLLAVTGGLDNEPLLILTALLLGALLSTGAAFLVASVAGDMMSALIWSIPILLVLTVPTLTILIPTLSGPWARAIPSYYLADTVFRAANFGLSWNAAAGNLLILLASALVLLAAGAVTLQRRFQ